MDRLLENVAGGVEVRTQYSGMGCPEQALAMILQGLTALDPNLENKITTYSATEQMPLPRRVLLSHSPSPLRAKHIFGDVCNAVGEDVLAELHRVAAKYRSEAEVTVQSGDATKKRRLRKATSSPDGGNGERFLRDCWAVLDKTSLPPGHTQYCYRCSVDCPTRSDASCLLRIEIAGTTCVAFSMRGKQGQWMHESAIPCIIWMWQLRQRRPHIVVHECTPQFTESVFSTYLEDIYVAETNTFCPSDLGMPSRRKRKYSILRLKKAIEGEKAFGGKACDFESMTFRAVQLPGAVYCQATQKHLDRWCVERALATGQPTRGCSQPGRAYTLVSQARLRTWKGYEELHAQPRYENKDIADLTQTPANSFRIISNYVPTMLKNSDLVNLRLRRPFHPLEYLHALNIPIFSSSRTCLMSGVAQNLSMQETQQLAGNGMNLSQVGSVLLFALATSRVKHQLAE